MTESTNNSVMVPTKGTREFTRSELEARLKSKFNLEADELKAHYPTDEALKAFYVSCFNEARKSKKRRQFEREDKGVPVDDYQLSKTEEQQSAELARESRKKIKARSKFFDKTMAQIEAPASSPDLDSLMEILKGHGGSSAVKQLKMAKKL